MLGRIVYVHWDWSRNKRIWNDIIVVNKYEVQGQYPRFGECIVFADRGEGSRHIFDTFAEKCDSLEVRLIVVQVDHVFDACGGEPDVIFYVTRPRKK